MPSPTGISIRMTQINSLKTGRGHQGRHEPRAFPSVSLELEGGRFWDVVDLVLGGREVDYVDFVEEQHEQDQVTCE